VHENLQEGAVDTILVATDKIMTSEDSVDMVKQARILAQATAQLIQAIKGEADRTPDSELQRKLFAAVQVRQPGLDWAPKERKRERKSFNLCCYLLGLGRGDLETR